MRNENMLIQYTHFSYCNFQLSNFEFFFLVFAQNIDCGYILGEVVLTSTHIMFWIEHKKNRYILANTCFSIHVKLGFNKYSLHGHVFRDGKINNLQCCFQCTAQLYALNLWGTMRALMVVINVRIATLPFYPKARPSVR